MTDPLSDDELGAIESRLVATLAGPWESSIEGRDHMSGDDFIRTGGVSRGPDIYVTVAVEGDGPRPASSADLDFIAAARSDVPRLLAEIRRLRSKHGA